MDEERQLIRRVLDGDREAGDEFARRYRGWVLGLARGRFGFDGEAAQDVLQATMAKLWADDCRALRAWQGRGKFSTYLTVIVSHLCLRERERRQRRESGREALPEGEAQEAARLLPHEADAPDLVEHGERRHAVARVARELSPRDRLLLALRFGDEREPKEIAAVVGLSPAAARKAIHDAVQRLRRRLARARPELFEPVTAAARFGGNRE